MPTLVISKNYADGDVLVESDLDDIRDALLTFFNTTKIDGDNIQDKGISLAKLADGTEGEMISWGASGAIEAISKGSDGYVLRANSSGAPSFGSVSDEDLTALTIGTIGSANNVASHVLADDSFFDPTDTDLHFYNLAADANDDVSHANPLNLAASGTVTYDIDSTKGVSNAAANMDNTAADFVTLQDSGFGPSGFDEEMSYGGWFKSDDTDWVGNTPGDIKVLISLGGETTGTHYCTKIFVENVAGDITVKMKTSNSVGVYDKTAESIVLWGSDTWHHVVGVIDFTNSMLLLYIDGELKDYETIANLRNPSAPRLTVGGIDGNADTLVGEAQDCFYYRGYPMSASEVRKVYASKVTHSLATADYMVDAIENKSSVDISVAPSKHIIAQTDAAIYHTPQNLAAGDSIRYILRKF